ncbi:MAG: DUF4112 domain-containing protein [Phycisphaerales bacterium]
MFPRRYLWDKVGASMFKRYQNPTQKQKAEKRLIGLAKVLDNAVLIPGTQVRVGYDALIGLVPGIGDLVTGAMSVYIVYEGYRLGASGSTIAKMMGNVVIDIVVGEIPGLGDVVDVFFRANVRNLKLLGIDVTQKQASPEVVGSAPWAEQEAERVRRHVQNLAVQA